MKLGFYTAALPNDTLEQAAKWGAESGFKPLKLPAGPSKKQLVATRVSHTSM